jgi:hypothetical protein
MSEFLLFIGVVLLIISQITAYWGPKKLLIISGVCSFLFGMCVGLTQGFRIENIISGLFIAILFTLLDVLSGLIGRFWKKRGSLRLDRYIREHPEFLQKFRRGSKR